MASAVTFAVYPATMARLTFPTTGTGPRNSMKRWLADATGTLPDHDWLPLNEMDSVTESAATVVKVVWKLVTAPSRICPWTSIDGLIVVEAVNDQPSVAVPARSCVASAARGVGAYVQSKSADAIASVNDAGTTLKRMLAKLPPESG